MISVLVACIPGDLVSQGPFVFQVVFQCSCPSLCGEISFHATIAGFAYVSLCSCLGLALLGRFGPHGLDDYASLCSASCPKACLYGPSSPSLATTCGDSALSLSPRFPRPPTNAWQKLLIPAFLAFAPEMQHSPTLNGVLFAVCQFDDIWLLT
jgi:hypothetical protein